MSMYQDDAARTECRYTADQSRRATAEMRALHACLGLATEVGELTDVYKKFVFYGKPIDFVNVAEEIGDVMWYLAIICNDLEISFDEIQQQNIAKLRKRFPDKFTETEANVRDLEAEREILEGYKPCQNQ